MKAVIVACVSVLALVLAASSARAADRVTKATATWYGQHYEGRLMANGRVFHKNDPTTVAARGFPLGTELELTNLANGRTLSVVVRDRGLFGRRHLDLSEAGARALGFREAGVAKLAVTVIR